MKTKTLLGVPALAPLFASGLLFLFPAARPGGEVRNQDGTPILFPEDAPQIAPDETEDGTPGPTYSAATDFEHWHRAQPDAETARSDAQKNENYAYAIRALWEARERGELKQSELDEADWLLDRYDRRGVVPAKPDTFYQIFGQWFPHYLDDYTPDELEGLRARVNQTVDALREAKSEIEAKIADYRDDLAWRRGNLWMIEQNIEHLENELEELRCDDNSAFALLCEIENFERDWSADFAAFALA